MKLKPSYQIDDDRFLTIPEAAEIISVSRRRIDAAVVNREVPVVVLGGSKANRIKLSDLRKWIASKTVEAHYLSPAGKRWQSSSVIDDWMGVNDSGEQDVE